MNDQVNFKVLPLFSDVISHINLNIDNKDILEKLKKEKFKKRHKMGYVNEFTKSYSGTDLNILKKFNKLEEELKKVIKLFINNVLRQNTGFKINTSWATKVSPKGYSTPHKHINSWLSAVYYPVGDPGFKIRFSSHKTPTYADHVIEYNIFNSSVYDVVAENNMLVIFPSQLTHEILLNESKKDRYSIAFNIVPKGKIFWGTDSQIEL